MRRLAEKARALKQEILALAVAMGHPGVPWYARGLLLVIVAYAVSPIDLIPDFIPVLGLLDDLVLVPLGILLLLRLVPARVMADCRRQVRAQLPSLRRLERLGVVVVALLWTALLVLLIFLLRR